MPDVDLTELVDIDPTRVDLVKSPANGFPVLVMKAVNAQGGIDEKPDIDGAEHVMQCLARLIQSEASELAIGAWDEICDIELLTQAVHLMGCFRAMEMHGDLDDGEPMLKDTGVSKPELESVVTYLAKRKFSAAERKRLAAAGHALPDGSYPIENEDDLHNAAILAHSGHGDVAAARKLIARRAKELGAANPMANETSKEGGVSDAPTTTPELPEAPEPQVDEPQVEKSIPELVTEEVAKAVQPLVERNQALEAEMAALKSTPIPGGPAVTSTTPASEGQRAQNLAKAAYHERLAGQTNGELSRYHAEKAAELRTAANG